MDPPLSGFSSGTGERPSPTRRELQLQGPRPTPLRVNKDSYKIKKPPVAPQQPQQPAAPAAAAATTTQNQPVIIYSVSPKVIHTTVSDFMGVVQRLTGSSSSQVGQTSGSTSGSGDLSPAARLASIEKTSPSERERERHRDTEQIEVSAIIENSSVEMGQIPGILSPAPTSLLPISPPGLFSPASDPWMLMQMNNMFPSPSALFSAPLVSPSPSSLHDLSPFFDF
ncbi:PREDICTED: protein MKS1-like [Ipomoea nil]|uniref:protein MKS1-like n=1 Tax=Ipomoea nil TaxID=35883 RepID=UPI000901B663|nr:PREDICTED: protein MKS1-like [Ipomoea nil]